ncbi:hypothetical protein IP92_00874 [Pseudoduganella flava]|uniref:Uncharacterized protein n=1 Tax=Pseudoduganella flava TaxID=871742 RepID=A0A562PYX4_9BURK|nr:hypothetical protein [Pseudoduganella flava]QGZ38759.1 hypothetical protein GO485_06640 [Pseudoduganella flava]TWI49662.1 hypothetical protein IP92_00874 [Pseudoduganella flava]
MISLPYLTLGLAVAAGFLALSLSLLSTPTYLVVFIATIASGLLAAGCAVYFFRAKSPLALVALIPGLLGAYVVADLFVRLLLGVRLLDLIE